MAGGQVGDLGARVQEAVAEDLRQDKEHAPILRREMAGIHVEAQAFREGFVTQMAAQVCSEYKLK